MHAADDSAAAVVVKLHLASTDNTSLQVAKLPPEDATTRLFIATDRILQTSQIQFLVQSTEEKNLEVYSLKENEKG